MATIRKRGDKWQVQVRKKGAPSACRSFHNRRDAEAWGRRRETAIDMGLPAVGPPNDYSLGELLARYASEITPHKKGREAESRRLNRLQRDSIASKAVSALDGPTLVRFRDRRFDDGVRACQYDLLLIRHAIHIARKEWGLVLSSNPVDGIRVPNGIKSRKRRLEEGEFEMLKNSAATGRNRYTMFAMELAIETAMRRSELLRLCWSDVDLVRRLAHLADTKNGDSRAVPLTSRAVSLLSALPLRSGKILPITESALRQAWERLVSRAGIVDLRFHDLRHEAISRYFESGLNIAEVALISGHRDVRMLFRYTHLRPANVVRRFEEKGI